MKEEGKLVRLQHDSDTSSYRIIRYLVTDLPAHQRRPGCSESEILLAFPIDDRNEPLITTQNVYAFLPIRDYGFSFLIQADFLLIASREEVDSSDWNRGLLQHIPNAFRRAVEAFNSGDLRYTWMLQSFHGWFRNCARCLL
jgi:hypothetical protein